MRLGSKLRPVPFLLLVGLVAAHHGSAETPAMADPAPPETLPSISADALERLWEGSSPAARGVSGEIPDTLATEVMAIRGLYMGHGDITNADVDVTYPQDGVVRVNTVLDLVVDDQISQAGWEEFYLVDDAGALQQVDYVEAFPESAAAGQEEPYAIAEPEAKNPS